MTNKENKLDSRKTKKGDDEQIMNSRKTQNNYRQKNNKQSQDTQRRQSKNQ